MSAIEDWRIAPQSTHIKRKKNKDQSKNRSRLEKQEQEFFWPDPGQPEEGLPFGAKIHEARSAQLRPNPSDDEYTLLDFAREFEQLGNEADAAWGEQKKAIKKAEEIQYEEMFGMDEE